MKTFPIILTNELHKQIKQEALRRDQSMKRFIEIAIINSLSNKPKTKKEGLKVDKISL